MLHVISRNDGSAIEAACAQVAREFGPGYEARDLKQRVRHVLRVGATHSLVNARYRVRAEMLIGSNLGYACRIADQWLADAKALRAATGSRLGLMIIAEVRLMLRWARRQRLEHEFFWAVEKLAPGRPDEATQRRVAP